MFESRGVGGSRSRVGCPLDGRVGDSRSIGVCRSPVPRDEPPVPLEINYDAVTHHLVEGIGVASTAIEFTSLVDGLQIQWLLAPGDVDMAGQLRRRIQQLVTVSL